MKIRFYGVRGSVPSPVSALQIQSKITAVIQRISAKDIVSADTREKFIAALPDWIFGTAGGNTACLELRGDDNTEIILDAGTGIRLLGKSADRPADKTYHLFLSHLHWDHIQGLPFFDPAYDSDTILHIYSCADGTEEFLRAQQREPYYPAGFEKFTKNITFHTIAPGSVFSVGGFSVSVCEMAHPGRSFSFAFTENGKKCVYATDMELAQNDFEPEPAHENVFKNADCIVLDAQYTVEELHYKVNWGHSSFCYAVDFAVHWGIKNVYLFHHEPMYDDKKLNSILSAARWYAKYIVHSDVNIFLAVEQKEIEI